MCRPARTSLFYSGGSEAKSSDLFLTLDSHCCHRPASTGRSSSHRPRLGARHRPNRRSGVTGYPAFAGYDTAMGNKCHSHSSSSRGTFAVSTVVIRSPRRRWRGAVGGISRPSARTTIPFKARDERPLSYPRSRGFFTAARARLRGEREGPRALCARTTRARSKSDPGRQAGELGV
jgi:hypothetical protein